MTFRWILSWKYCNQLTQSHSISFIAQLLLYRVFNLKVDRILTLILLTWSIWWAPNNTSRWQMRFNSALKGLIWVIYLLRFTTCYITQLTCIYSKCWKWCPFISVHLSTRFIMFLATFLSVLSFTSSMARVIFIFKTLKFLKETLSTVSVRHRF